MIGVINVNYFIVKVRPLWLRLFILSKRDIKNRPGGSRNSIVIFERESSSSLGLFQGLLYLHKELLGGAVVGEYCVGHFNDCLKILLVGVGVAPLALLICDKFIK